MKYLQSNKVLYWSSLLLLVLLCLLLFFHLSESDIEILINSDSLYLPSIYKDLYETGNTFYGWNLSPAPSFFPDMPIFFIYMKVTGSIISSIILYGLTQLILISLGLLLIVKQFDNKAYLYISFSHLLLVLFILVELVDNDFSFSYYIISNSYHMSAFISALFCLFYSLSFYKTSNTIWLSMLLINGTLALMSDKLFMATFIIPATAVFLFVGLFKHRKRSIVLLVSFIILYYFGDYFFEQLKNGQTIIIPQPHKYLAYDNILNSFTTMFDQLGNYLFSFSIRSLILIISFTCFVLLGLIILKNLNLIRRKGSEVVDFKFIVFLFFLIFSLSVFLAPALNGSYTGWDTIRYNYSAYLALCVLFPVVIFTSFSTGKAFSKLYYTPLLILTLLSVFFSGDLLLKKDTSPIVNYYPQKVNVIDSFVEKENLSVGIAPYWDAKVITMFSKKNIKVLAAFEVMTPYYHATNQNWFYKNKDGSPVIFDFIIAPNQQMLDEAEKYLGQLNKIIETPNFIIVKTKRFRFNPETYLPYVIND